MYAGASPALLLPEQYSFSPEWMVSRSAVGPENLCSLRVVELLTENPGERDGC